VTTIKAVQNPRWLRLHGGVSVERFMRDAKLAEIGEGTSEMQRMIIAKSLCATATCPPSFWFHRPVRATPLSQPNCRLRAKGRSRPALCFVAGACDRKNRNWC